MATHTHLYTVQMLFNVNGYTHTRIHCPMLFNSTVTRTHASTASYWQPTRLSVCHIPPQIDTQLSRGFAVVMVTICCHASSIHGLTDAPGKTQGLHGLNVGLVCAEGLSLSLRNAKVTTRQKTAITKYNQSNYTWVNP
jgi:hypothetical protein